MTIILTFLEQITFVLGVRNTSFSHLLSIKDRGKRKHLTVYKEKMTNEIIYTNIMIGKKMNRNKDHNKQLTRSLPSIISSLCC
jgi:hypothetical protein